MLGPALCVRCSYWQLLVGVRFWHPAERQCTDFPQYHGPVSTKFYYVVHVCGAYLGKRQVFRSYLDALDTNKVAACKALVQKVPQIKANNRKGASARKNRSEVWLSEMLRTPRTNKMGESTQLKKRYKENQKISECK